MTTFTCPNGHSSSSDDYCDICGEPIGGASAPSAGTGAAPSGGSAPATAASMSAAGLSVSGDGGGKTCPNCGGANLSTALFCEECGYDFTTGALPEPLDPPDVAAPAVPATPVAPVPPSGLAAPPVSVPPALVPPTGDVPMPHGLLATSPAADLTSGSSDSAPSTPDSAMSSAGAGSGDGTLLAANLPDPVPPSTDPGADAASDPAAAADGDAAGTAASAPEGSDPAPDPARSSSADPASDSGSVSAPGDPGSAVGSGPVRAAASSSPSAAPNGGGPVVTLPPPTGAISPVAPDPLAAPLQGWVVEIWVDPQWYESQDVAQSCPSPGMPTVVPLRERSVLIGRPSLSRNIRPQVDVSPDTGVSRRHAQLTTDGQRWWVEDLQSANGTYLGTPGAELPRTPLAPGQRHELTEDSRIYLGAWSRLVVRRATAEDGV